MERDVRPNHDRLGARRGRPGWRRSSWRVGTLLGWALASWAPLTVMSPTLVAQEPLPLVSVAVDLEAYGIERPEEVRRGRVSIAYAPEGPRLAVYYLRTDPVRSRVTYPEPPPTPEPDPRPSVRTRETALWVWTTEEILRRPGERDAFLDLVEREGITRVFLYLAPAEGERPASGYIPFSSEEMGPLVAALRARGALTYALDGDRDYALEENHAGVLRTVRRLVEHNRKVAPAQRFYGVRYDIEPYLVPGFQGPLRQELLDGYVDLVAGVADVARAGDLAVAVDVPFWLDAPDEETGRYMMAVHDGRRARVLEHLMALVDDLAVMDYRTSALGPDGALAHAYNELRLAEDNGVDVFVGVETVRLVDEDLHTFSGPVHEGLPAHADARWLVLEQEASGSARIWLVDGERALSELRARVRDARLLRYWPAGRPIRVAADKQSFHDHGAQRMREVTGEVVRRLVSSPAFAGLAYHDYRGLRELLARE